MWATAHFSCRILKFLLCIKEERWHTVLSRAALQFSSRSFSLKSNKRPGSFYAQLCHQYGFVA